MGSITKVSVAAALFCLAACRSGGPRRVAVIGQAYVGPAVLNLRRDISLASGTVAVVKHGERLSILQQRRVFFRVRTANGTEGWTSASQLLSASDMAGIEQLAQRAAKMPVQGAATTYDLLRVHVQPSARSPSFIQIQAKEKFAVLGHAVVPRIELPRAPLIPPTPKKAPPPKKQSKTSARFPPPPMPLPPALPSNWQELSKPGLDEEDAPEEEEPAPAAPEPVPEDDWSLIRTASGQTGWVLTRRVSMAIPDEVAQYAEGHRIVSYFSLGAVQDGDSKKDIWLWTTTGTGHFPYDFQSFRVFIWSLRRHRYETAYIERKIEGYEPVLLGETPFAGAGKTKGEPVKYPGFSICMRKQDGSLVRRDYVLLTNIVRFAGERGCELPPPVFTVTPASPAGGPPASVPPPAAAAPAGRNLSFLQNLKGRLEGWWHRRKGRR